MNFSKLFLPVDREFIQNLRQKHQVYSTINYRIYAVLRYYKSAECECHQSIPQRVSVRFERDNTK